jgi:D-alanine-D-alanine ligase
MRVAVVQGGPSAEAEVSRASAAGVAKALVQAGHDVALLELDAFLAEALRVGRFDVVFPVAHGAVGEDGSLQGLIEVVGLPYVGSGVLASALAMDKRQARIAFAAAGLPVAAGMPAHRGADADAIARIARETIGTRLVVKPASNGSAIGVSRLEESVPTSAVARAIEAVWNIDECALVEHFARGAEVTCGVLHVPLHLRVAPGTPGGGFHFEPAAFPPTLIESPKDAFYTYEARYARGRSQHTCPAPLSEVLTAKVQRIAEQAHTALGCRDLSRVDFIVGDDGDLDRITLLEVNTMPGFTPTSLYPEAAQVIGLSFSRLCGILVSAAESRGAPRRNAAKPLPT